jgi:hypothetical protein
MFRKPLALKSKSQYHGLFKPITVWCMREKEAKASLEVMIVPTK